MSHRPTAEKRVRRMVKSMRVPLPAYIDLIQWLQDRRHARNAGEARKIIYAGRVRSESHTMGKDAIFRTPSGRLLGSPLVPAHLRSSLYVTADG